MTTTIDQFEFASQEVIRPAAVLSEAHARLILAGLATHDHLSFVGHAAGVKAAARFDDIQAGGLPL